MYPLPEYHTAVSLYQTTATILTTRADIEFLLDLRVLSQFVDDIEQSLYETQAKIEQQEYEKWEELLEGELGDYLGQNIDEILASESSGRSTIVIEPDEEESEK